jgi:hypothetical protein
MLNEKLILLSYPSSMVLSAITPSRSKVSLLQIVIKFKQLINFPTAYVKYDT